VSVQAEAWLWIAQRATALILAIAVTVHLATIIYAVHRGLSAAAFLERTQGNIIWLAFYFVFALAAAVHGGIGLRGMLREALGWRGAGLEAATALIVLAIAGGGCRAALALFA